MTVYTLCTLYKGTQPEGANPLTETELTNCPQSCERHCLSRGREGDGNGIALPDPALQGKVFRSITPPANVSNLFPGSGTYKSQL